MNSRRKIVLLLAFCSSVGLHGVAYAALSVQHRTPLRPNQPSEMNFELLPLKALGPEPEPASRALEPAAKERPVPVRTNTSDHAVKIEAAAVKATPGPAPVLDLSGVTLSNESGAGFAMPMGDGSALRAPVGFGANHGQALAVSSAAPSTPKLPTLVAVSDLSEHPRAPSLTDLLRANYPAEARERGLRGSASLRARIDADGVIRSVRLLSESSAGFGSACRRTLLGSHWSAPRDKNGSAVATEIVYTCHFEVDR